jgi:hypothetical protein
MKYLILLMLLVGCGGPETLEVRCFKNKKLLYKETVSKVTIVSSDDDEVGKFSVCVIKDIRNDR